MYLTKLYNVNGDDYEIHRIVMSHFPGTRPLFQTKGGCVTVLSENKPVSLNKHDETEVITLTFTAGDIRLFTLRINPTKRDNTTKKLCGLHGNDVLRWISRKSSEAGFDILDYKIEDEGLRLSKKNGMTITLRSIFLTGVLQVTDPDQFLLAVKKGIGRAKGMGLGLINIF